MLMSESAIGVVFGENAVQLIQLSRSENGWKLDNLAEAKLPHKFRLLTLSDDTRFADIRQTFHKIAATISSGKETGVAIDQDLLFVKEINVDPDIPKEDVEKQAFWEAQQFLPENLGKNYKVLWSRISPQDSLVLLILYRKLIIERIQQLFESTEKSLQNLSFDQMAAMTAMENLFQPKGRLVGLVDVRKNSATITLLKDGKYFRLKKLDFGDSEEDILESETILAKEINKEIIRLLLDAEIKESDAPVSQLYVFGEKANQSLISALEGGPSLEVKLANPFSAVEISDDIKGQIEAIENPANWLAAFGAAQELLG